MKIREKRKPGVPYILEALNLLHTSEEESSDDENEINLVPSEELLHTDDQQSLDVNVGSQETDSENGDNEDDSEDCIANSEDDFFSDNCEEHNEQEHIVQNPLMSSESECSQLSTDLSLEDDEQTEQCDSDNSDNYCSQPLKRRKH